MGSAQLPLASVIVPTFSRPDRLDRCLRALSRLDYPRERFEVVVVDDGSPHSPAPVVDRYRDRLTLSFRRQENLGPAAARNLGATVAGGDVLAFTDDDCAPAPDWLRVLAARVVEDRQVLAGGHTINLLRGSPYSRASQLLVDYLYRYLRTPGAKGPPFFCSNNLALTADGFRDIGGFVVTPIRAAGEDRDLCYRWARLGRELEYVPEATVFHAHQMDALGFCHQHFNYGRGAFHFHRGRHARGEQGWLLEPAQFYAGVLRYPHEREDVRDRWRQSALLLISQAANALGFLCEAAGGIGSLNGGRSP